MSLFAAAAALAAQVASPGTAFVNVDVIDVETGTLMEDRTVLVQDKRIAAILDDGAALPEGVELIDGEGRYLIPGLNDMHVHMNVPYHAPLHLAYGITTVRNMWGLPITQKLIEAIEGGEWLGPHIVTTGPLIDGPGSYWQGATMTDDPDEARAEVARQAEAGYKFIKIYNRLSPEVYAAIVDEAKARGVGFLGHVPDAVPIEQAVRDGMMSIEHYTGFDDALWRTAFSDRDSFLEAVEKGELALEDKVDTARRDALFTLLAEQGTAIVPTTIVKRAWRSDCEQSTAIREREEMRFIPSGLAAWWAGNSACDPDGMSPEWVRANRQIVALEQQWTLQLHEAGVLLLAGSDIVNPLTFPGESLHEELELFVEAGLTPAEALRTATMNAGTYFGDPAHGRVAVGSQADLVLLTANPLEDISNTRSIEGVMVDGRWLNAASLDAFREWSAQGIALANEAR